MDIAKITLATLQITSPMLALMHRRMQEPRPVVGVRSLRPVIASVTKMSFDGSQALSGRALISARSVVAAVVLAVVVDVIVRRLTGVAGAICCHTKAV